MQLNGTMKLTFQEPLETAPRKRSRKAETNSSHNLAKREHVPRPAVPPVPVPAGTYLNKLRSLKEQVFLQMVDKPELFLDFSQSAKRCQPPKLHNLNGFHAFSQFLRSEFYDAPWSILNPVLGQAWSSCPDKAIWQFYAHMYNKHHRSGEAFTDWLNLAPKSEAGLLIVPFEAP